MCALESGNLEAVKVLIAAGADVNAKNNNGETALMRASKSRNYEADGAVSVLIEAGTEVDAKDKNGWTALIWALCAHRYKPGIIKLLLEAGAVVNVKGVNLDKYGIVHAIKFGDDCAAYNQDKAVEFYKLASEGELDFSDKTACVLKVKAMQKIADIVSPKKHLLLRNPI